MRSPSFISLAFALLLPGIASAQTACQDGLGDTFTVESFQASASDAGYMSGMRLEIVLSNNGDRGVRMLDGSIIFQDVLGRDILRIAMEPDQRIEAGGSATQVGIYTNTRLLDVEQADVVITTCVRGMVFADGEVFKVDE